MTDFHLYTMTDPKAVGRFQAAISSDWCINYITHLKDGKPKSIEFVLDVEDKKDSDLLEAIRQ